MFNKMFNIGDEVFICDGDKPLYKDVIESNVGKLYRTRGRYLYIMGDTGEVSSRHSTLRGCYAKHYTDELQATYDKYRKLDNIVQYLKSNYNNISIKKVNIIESIL